MFFKRGKNGPRQQTNQLDINTWKNHRKDNQAVGLQVFRKEKGDYRKPIWVYYKIGCARQSFAKILDCCGNPLDKG